MQPKTMTHKEYDALEGERSSKLKRMDKTPAHYLLESEETDSLIFGRAFHGYLLQPMSFPDEYIIKPDVDGRTKEGKETLKRFYELSASRTLISHDDYEKIKQMTLSINAQPTASDWLKEGIAEACVTWTDEETGLKCKSLNDWLMPTGRVVDIKTTKSGGADEREFYKAVRWFYKYHVSAAMSLEGLLVNNTTPRYNSYSFIVVEKEAPYRCECFDLSDKLIEEGNVGFHKLLKLVKYSKDNNYWPAYTCSGSNLLIGNQT